jgi:hypothetical protein
MHKGKCILHATKKNKLKVWVGITLGGILLIALALIVAIVVYRNKLRRKEQGGCQQKKWARNGTKIFLVPRLVNTHI